MEEYDAIRPYMHTRGRLKTRFNYSVTNEEYDLLCKACTAGYQMVIDGNRATIRATQKLRHKHWNVNRKKRSKDHRELHSIILPNGRKAYAIFSRTTLKILTVMDPEKNALGLRVKVCYAQHIKRKHNATTT